MKKYLLQSVLLVSVTCCLAARDNKADHESIVEEPVLHQEKAARTEAATVTEALERGDEYFAGWCRTKADEIVMLNLGELASLQPECYDDRTAAAFEEACGELVGDCMGHLELLVGKSGGLFSPPTTYTGTVAPWHVVYILQSVMMKAPSITFLGGDFKHSPASVRYAYKMLCDAEKRLKKLHEAEQKHHAKGAKGETKTVGPTSDSGYDVPSLPSDDDTVDDASSASGGGSDVSSPLLSPGDGRHLSVIPQITYIVKGFIDAYKARCKSKREVDDVPTLALACAEEVDFKGKIYAQRCDEMAHEVAMADLSMVGAHAYKQITRRDISMEPEDSYYRTVKYGFEFGMAELIEAVKGELLSVVADRGDAADERWHVVKVLSALMKKAPNYSFLHEGKRREQANLWGAYSAACEGVTFLDKKTPQYRDLADFVVEYKARLRELR